MGAMSSALLNGRGKSHTSTPSVLFVLFCTGIIFNTRATEGTAPYRRLVGVGLDGDTNAQWKRFA